MQYAVLALLLVSVAPVHAPAAHESGPALGAIASGKGKRLSDADIRQRMIDASIESYPGPCACPYQRASNGSQCGRRSAYSRRGGYETLCYPSDISNEMVQNYRAEMGL